MCYKLHPFSYLLARFFANIQYISLVNILAKKSIVPELVQNEFTVNELVNKLNFILDNKNKITNDYNDTIKQLGDGGCFDKISQVIYSDLLRINKQHNT